MINVFLDGLEKTNNVSITGTEGLGIGEKIGLFFKELSLTYDKAFASIKNTAHDVNYNKARNLVTANNPNYFKHVNDLIATPAFFDSNKMSFEDYVTKVSLSAPFLSAMITETNRFYDWLKVIARTGKVGYSFKFTIKSTNQMFFDVEAFVGDLKEHKNTKAKLKDHYQSFDEVFNIIQGYNAAVALVKPRDIEVMAKSLNLVSQIGNLIATKVKSSDLVLDADGLEILQTEFKKFVDYANYTGAMISLMNELTAVFKDQLIDIEKMK